MMAHSYNNPFKLTVIKNIKRVICPFKERGYHMYENIKKIKGISCFEPDGI